MFIHTPVKRRAAAFTIPRGLPDSSSTLDGDSTKCVLFEQLHYFGSLEEMDPFQMLLIC